MAAKGNTISKTLVWILMGLLFVGLAGFGATSLTGTVRSIGSVGDEAITTDEYFRAVSQELRGLAVERGEAVTFRQAEQAGIIDQVISRLVVSAALDHETARMGLSVSDARLGREIVQIPAFQGVDGTFDRDAYARALQNNGWTEAEFEADLRKETARALLRGAVLAGNPMPSTYTETLLDHFAETRDFSFGRVTPDMLEEPVAAPTEAELRAYHGDNQDRYTLPETRMIAYAWLTPDMLLDTVEVDEAALRDEYEANAAQYVQPERRLVERLVLGSAEAAAAAREALDDGTQSFEGLVDSRGLSLVDVDLGDVTREDLGAAADAVFAAETGAVVGPVETSLGPAFFRVNGVLDAVETSFEEARPMLRDLLAQDRARRVIADRAADYDDLLAGGATVEQLANETEMRLGEIAWTPQSEAGIAGYDAFRSRAAALAPGDFPEIAELGDGGIFAARLDEIRPPQPQPFEAVRDEVLADWTRTATANAVLERAENMAGLLGEGRTFEALGLTAEARRDQDRGARLVDLPAGTMEAVFALQPGETTALPHGASGSGAEAIVLRLDAVRPPEPGDPDVETLRQAFARQAESQLADDLYAALVQDIQSRAGLQIDQQAINAVNTNFP